MADELQLIESFIQAVKANDVDGVKLYMKYNGDISSDLCFEGWEEMTPLHYTAKEGLVDTMKELLKDGCDVNKGMEKATEHMYHNTALHLACQFPDSLVALQMAKCLIDHGADVNQGDYAERTPLVMSCESGHLELVEILLSLGADINHIYEEEEPPYDVSRALRFMVQDFKYSDDVCEAFNNNSALIQACREHHLQIVKLLISKGADLSRVNGIQNTALHVACMSFCRSGFSENSTRFSFTGHLDIVKVLVENGAVMNCLNEYKETPIDRAIYGLGCVDTAQSEKEIITECIVMMYIIMFLVEAGCEVNVKDIVLDDGKKKTSPLSRLLMLSKTIMKKYRDSLGDLFTKAVASLLLAGSLVTRHDIKTLKKDEKYARKILCLVSNYYALPHSLKQLCKYRIRHCVHKPLHIFLPQTDLPSPLKGYVMTKS